MENSTIQQILRLVEILVFLDTARDFVPKLVHNLTDLEITDIVNNDSMGAKGKDNHREALPTDG